MKFVNLNATISVTTMVMSPSVEAAAVVLMYGNDMAVKLPSESLQL